MRDDDRGGRGSGWFHCACAAPLSLRAMASSLLRAVVDGCSTTGRSLLPAVGFQFIGGPAALWTQERGMAKKANRRVEVCLLQVRKGRAAF